MDPDNQKKAVFSYVLDMLSSDNYPAGSVLPSGKELSEKFSLSRYHVHEALAEFYQRGLLESRKKGGITVLRSPEEYEKRLLRSSLSNKVLIINHMPIILPWSIVHINKSLFDELLPPLEKAGLEMIFEELPVTDAHAMQIHILKQILNKHTPRVIIVFAGGKTFENFQDIYFLHHSKVIVFTRSGFVAQSPLWSSVGIANSADGLLAAETAFSNGADRIIYCYKSSLSVQYWQLERRNGIQLCLSRRQGGRAFVDDYHVSGSFPFASPCPRTCLIAQNDELAAELIDAGRKINLEPGRDYKIIGFGDDSRYRNYNLTTLRPDFHSIGAALAGAVLDQCGYSGGNHICAKLIPSLLIRRQTL